MQVDLTQKLIVLAPSRQYLIDEARNYGLTGMEDMFILVTNVTEANAVLNDGNLPRETPWCIIAPSLLPDLSSWVAVTLNLPGVQPGGSPRPLNYFPPPQTFAKALRMQTVEVGMNPRLLRGQGGGYERP